MMGKTSNRPDFGTEGNEGPNDFTALIDLAEDFFESRIFIAASPFRPAYAYLRFGISDFSLLAFFEVWTFGVWDLVRPILISVISRNQRSKRIAIVRSDSEF
jgi:hypothetical protein